MLARGYYYPPMAVPMFTRTVVTDALGNCVLDLPSRDFPLEFRLKHGGRFSSTAWSEAQRAGEGEGHVQLVAH